MQKEEVVQTAKTVLRSVAASFPVYASVATWWAENETYVKEKRLAEILDAIKAELEKHAAEIDAVKENEAKQKEEFCSLMERTIARALTQSEDGKIRELARVFVGVHLRSQAVPFDEKAWMLDVIAELTAFDVETLRRFLRTDYIQINHLLPYTGISAHPEKDEELISRYYVSLKRLLARGIVSEAPVEGGGISSASIYSKWVNSVLSEAYRITPFGKRIVGVLKEMA